MPIRRTQEGQRRDRRSVCSWAMMLRSRPIATERSPSRTARSSPLCTTVSSRRRKTTKPLARPSRSLPGIPRTFSSWSRTQRRTPRPAGGDSVTSARTVHLAATRCSRLAPPATRRLFAILSSPVTHVDGVVTRGLPKDSAEQVVSGAVALTIQVGA